MKSRRSTYNLLFVVFSIIFLFYSCLQPPADPDKEAPKTATLNVNIEKYLDTQVMQPGFGGRIFSAFKIFSEEDNKVFLWAFLQEYYENDSKIMMGSGWSVPMVLEIERNTGWITIKGHKTPRDGEQYAQDIKKVFPKNIRTQIFTFPGSDEMQELQRYSAARAKKP